MATLGKVGIRCTIKLDCADHQEQLLVISMYERVSESSTSAIWCSRCMSSLVLVFQLSYLAPLFSVSGPGSTNFLEYLTPSDLAVMPTNKCSLSVLVNEHGGIIDDLMITKLAENKYYLVTNAGRRERDLEWIQKWLTRWNNNQGKETPEGRLIDGEVKFEVMEDWGLVALQGRCLLQLGHIRH